jgi:hypothetical protein
MFASATAVLAGGSYCRAQVPGAASPSFEPGYVELDQGHQNLILFPIHGKDEVKIPLPETPALSANPHGVREYGGAGYAIYVLNSDPSAGMLKIEFDPPRISGIPGTFGFYSIWHLTVARPSERILVSGNAPGLRPGQCGIYEIDEAGGAPRQVLTGAFPECGGGGGPVSPEGKLVLGYAGGNVRVIDLATCATRVVRGLEGLTPGDVAWWHRVAWSPDGQWIAAAVKDRIVLIDARTLSR